MQFLAQHMIVIMPKRMQQADGVRTAAHHDPVADRAGNVLASSHSDTMRPGPEMQLVHEPDEPAPVCEYGRSKAAAEARLIDAGCDALIVRTSAFFGPWDRYNFLFDTVARLKRGEEVVASDRDIVSPTYVPDLVHATLDLLLDEKKGIWHLTSQGAVSWHDLACEAADRAKASRGLIRAAQDSPGADNSMTSRRGLLLRPLGDALTDFFEHSETLRELT